MTTLPEPALTLTIPSLHDGTTLDCRLYHPASLAAANPRAPPWRRHAAVVAHPYAPMGGCYDDAVVEAVAAQVLREGFLVGTFNFRGAGHSAGRTSWTARPERDDYASFVGFMVHYVHRLDPFRHDDSSTSASSSPESSQDDDDDDENRDGRQAAAAPLQRPPVLLMCGYSYGAMVTTQLGPLDALLEPLAAPAAGSDAAEIRLRAEHLAEQQNSMLGDVRSEATAQRRRRREQQQQHLGIPTSPSRLAGVRVGGDEGPGARRSHESLGRRSFSLDDAEDRLRRGVQDLLALRRSRHEGGGHHHMFPRRSVSGRARPTSAPSVSAASGAPGRVMAGADASAMDKPAGLVVPRPAYLLVSPLQGLVTHLATMSLMPSALHGRRRQHEHRARHGHEADAEAEAATQEAKLVRNPTLAVFGDRDVFVPAGRLRAWTARLGGAGGSLFRGLEVPSAGHFWAEEGVLGEMREAAGQFAGALLRGG